VVGVLGSGWVDVGVGSSGWVDVEGGVVVGTLPWDACSLPACAAAGVHAITAPAIKVTMQLRVFISRLSSPANPLGEPARVAPAEHRSRS
jgi:hypothetical protein